MVTSWKKLGFGLAAGVAALGGASAASATDFHIGQTLLEDPNFYVTVGGPVTPTPPYPSFISATFYNSFKTSTSFDDSFIFTIPEDGLGGGALILSLAKSGDPTMVITDVLINGISYAAQLVANSQLALSVSDIPITAFQENTIRVIGQGYGTYSGNISFQAAAVPEPAIWAMMLCGFGLVGYTMRQRRTNVSLA